MGVTLSLSDNVFLGQNAGSLESSPALDPVTKVILLVDDENYYEAGTGTNVMEVSCPYGSQQMANDILAALQGYSYQPATAGDALLDPAAEFGDAMTVDGLYTVIANMDITFDQLMTSDVGAPGEQEIESEYPYQSQQTTETNRKLAQTRSLITKTAEEINLSVENLEEEMGQTLRVAADGVTITNAQGDTLTIDGGQIDASKINAAELNASQINVSDLQLTGAISWADLDSGAQGQVTSAQNTASNALASANSANSTLNQWGYGGSRTYINGAMIETGTVTAATLQGGTVNLLSASGAVAGAIYIDRASSVDTSAIRLESSGALSITAEYGALYLAGGTISSYGGRLIQCACVALIPNTANYASLGWSDRRWNNVYLANNPDVSSDARLKENISDLDERYLSVFDAVSAKRYRLIGEKGYHTGFVAQDFQAALIEAGLDPSEFSAVGCGNFLSLKYGELLALAWEKIKSLDKRIKGLEAML